METLANLESFVRSGEETSFSRAARRMSVTPAAVSRNVGMLERNLGVRLFQQSTRNLVLTEAGERFLAGIGDKLDGLQAAIVDVAAEGQEPVGVLKISLSTTFGADYILPLLPGFLERYPAVKAEWHFTNRQVDLIREGFDIGIGGGFDLAPGLVARRLAPAHLIAVASPAYMASRTPPAEPGELVALAGIVMRSETNGRIRHWTMRNSNGGAKDALLRETVVLNDPHSMVRASLLGLGVALVAVPDVVPHLRSGALVRLITGWYADAGAISLYYASRTHRSAKIAAFADHVLDHFKRERLSEYFAAIE